MNPISKIELRRLMRQKRSALPPAEAFAAADHLTTQAMRILKRQPRELIGGYVPTYGEIDIFPLLHALADGGWKLALPGIANSGIAMEFRPWSPGESLAPQHYGIKAPAAGQALLHPPLLLVPLLAFDKQGYRLGYGKGFYDRYLNSLSGEKPLTLGCAYDWQGLDTLPVDGHDVALDAIITDKRVLRISPRAAGL